MSQWHSSSFSAYSHVKIHNKTDSVVAVFSFSYHDPTYISYVEKCTKLHPRHSVVLKAPSLGAGKITIGVATGIVREAGGSAVDWAVAVACADIIEMAMMKQPRFKLRLCNVKDNTECSIVENDSLEVYIQGRGVSKTDLQSETEIEGACNTSTGILRCLQEVGTAVVTGGGSIVLKNAAKMTAKQALKAVTKKQLKREVKKRLKKKVKALTKKELNEEFKRRTGADMGPLDFTELVSDARATKKAILKDDRGHIMKISSNASGPYSTGWVCDMCRRKGTGARWHCLPCRADVCFRCIPR